MRKVSILSLWLAALLMAVCFIGCSSGNSTEDSPATETSSGDNTSDNNNTNNAVVFVSEQALGVIYKAYFYADGKYKMTSAVNSYAVETESEGTYTGDASIDGTVMLTQLKYLLNHTLVDDPDHTQIELTISGGKFTVPRGDEYTRQ